MIILGEGICSAIRWGVAGNDTKIRLVPPANVGFQHVNAEFRRKCVHVG